MIVQHKRSAAKTAQHLADTTGVPHAIVKTNDGVRRVIPLLTQQPQSDAAFCAAWYFERDVKIGNTTIEHAYA